MKTPLLTSARTTLCSTFAAALMVGGGAPTLRAADDEPTVPAERGRDERPRRNNGNGQGEGEGRWPRSESRFGTLTDPEKAELRSALDAVWHDPTVLAAREAMQEAMQKAGDAYKEALRKSMENANPKVREILTKMLEDHGPWGRGEGRPPGGAVPVPPDVTGTSGADPQDPPFFRSLTAEDRQILRDAKQKADQDEAVKAATARKDAAESREEKIAALRDLRETLHKAMVAADPRVADVFSKLPVPGRERGEGRKNGRDGRDESDGRREGRRDHGRDGKEKPEKTAKDA